VRDSKRADETLDPQTAAALALEERLGHNFADVGLFHLALAHRSHVAESAAASSNERLEFLGDAVLGFVVTEHLYATRPALPEGDLARIRAAVVSTAALAPIAARLGVGEALLLGRGEAASGGRAKDSLLADALEALIGAAFLDGGIDVARRLVIELLAGPIDVEAAQRVLGDPKNRLQELVAQIGGEPPSYVVDGRGPDHERHFQALVRAGDVVGRGEGRSKKRAEQLAAEDALAALEQAAEDGA
jgi:ribonuclease III